jgi:HEAT repeat protein
MFRSGSIADGALRMTERRRGDSHDTPNGSEFEPQTAPRSAFRARLTFVTAAAAGCGVLVWVWKTIGDQNHREALFAARTLYQAAKPADRVNAIRDLVRFGANDGRVTIPAIVASLSDADHDVRVEAARSLGAAACASAFRGVDDALVKSAIEALLHTLDDPQPVVRSAAVNSLGSIAITKGPSGVIQPEPLISAFREMMKDQDAVVRAEAIAAIGRAGPASESDPPSELIEALHDGSSPNRLTAIEVLTRFHAGMERVLPHFIRGFERSGPGTPERAAYVRAIRVTRPPAVTSACLPALVAALASPDAELRFEAASAISSFGPRCQTAVPALIEILEKQPLDLENLGPGKPDPSSWDPGCAAATVLGQVLGSLDESTGNRELSRKIVATLVSVLESGHPARRFAAIHALKHGRFVAAKTAALPSLIRLMKMSDPNDDPFENGPAAANALSFIFNRTESAVEVMKILTESVASPSKRSVWAIDALAIFGPVAESAIPDLIRVLEQSNGEKMPLGQGVAAVRALGEIAPGTPASARVVQALSRALESKSKETRLAALMALIRFGPAAAGAIEHIRARRDTDPDPEVRRSAAGALKKLEPDSIRLPSSSLRVPLEIPIPSQLEHAAARCLDRDRKPLAKSRIVAVKLERGHGGQCERF